MKPAIKPSTIQAKKPMFSPSEQDTELWQYVTFSHE
jgi:hypothetical protein